MSSGENQLALSICDVGTASNRHACYASCLEEFLVLLLDLLVLSMIALVRSESILWATIGFS